MQVRVMHTFHLYLQMLVICGQELQKSCHTNYIAPGNKFIVSWIIIMLDLEDKFNCNSDISDKT